MAYFFAAFTPDIPVRPYGGVMAQHIKNSLSNRLLVLIIAAMAAVFYTLYKAKQRSGSQADTRTKIRH